MDLNDRRDQTGKDGQEWFPHLDHNISHTSLGLCGEVGEIANMVKKYERASLTFEYLQKKVPEEIVGSIVYLLKLASQLDMDVEMEYDRKREYNKHRFAYKTYQVRTSSDD